MQTNFLNIHDVILLLTAMECIFLAILTQVLPAKALQSHRVLAGSFLLVAIDLIGVVIIWNEQLADVWVNHTSLITSFLTASLLLKGPALYFYLQSLSTRLDIYSWKNLIHFIPAIAAVLIVNIFNIDSNAWRHTTSIFGPDRSAGSLVWVMTKFFPFFYIVASILAEYRLRKNIDHLYSGISLIELKLADIILIGFFAHSLCSLTGYFFGGYLAESVRDSLGILINYLTVMLVKGLFVFGLIHNRQLLSEFVLEPVVARVMSETELAPKIEVIENGIHQRKLYLESNINLERFADQIGLKPRDASVVINSHYKLTFSEFINHHRIEEAKRLLLLPETDGTIQDIIDKSGFNSSSAFHRFFKRMVGVTPTQFRKQATGVKKIKNTSAQKNQIDSQKKTA